MADDLRQMIEWVEAEHHAQAAKRAEWHAIHEAARRILRHAQTVAWDELVECAASTFGPRHEFRSNLGPSCPSCPRMYDAADAWATARNARRRVDEVQWRL